MRRPYSTQAFLAVFALFGALLFRVTLPVLGPALVALCLAALLSPWQRALERRSKYPRLTAALLTAAVLLLLIVPLGIFIAAVARQAVELSNEAVDWITRHGVRRPSDLPLPGWARPWGARLDTLMPTAEQLRGGAASAARSVGGFLTGFMGALGDVALGLFLGALGLYYLLVEGPRWRARLVALLPLEPEHTEAFFEEFRAISQSVLVASVGEALAQAVLVAIAWLIVGFPSTLLAAAVTFVFAFVPVVGSGIVWAPATVVLLAQGRVGAGIFMLLWGGGVVATSDNVLRPLLTRGSTNMHPLLVFLSLFGGLAVYGVGGLLLGPLFAGLFVAALRIYQREFAPGRSPTQPPPPPAHPPRTVPSKEPG